jgi:CTD small phosphatase-like protein 2
VVLDHLDPENKYIQHRLFREHCHSTSDGMFVKDLRVINRPLSDMVLIDNAAYSYAFQPENGIPIIPYYEGKNDYELSSLEKYLSSMILSKDVRDVNRKIFKL